MSANDDTSLLQKHFTLEKYDLLKSMTVEQNELELWLKENIIFPMQNEYFNAFTKKNLTINYKEHRSNTQRFFTKLMNGEDIIQILDEEQKSSPYRCDHSYKNMLDKSIDSLVKIMYFCLDDFINKYDYKKMCVVFHNIIKVHSFIDDKCSGCGSVLLFNSLFDMGKNPVLTVDTCKFQTNLHEVVINFPSGVILANDWFRDEKNILQQITDIDNSQIAKELMAEGFEYIKYRDGNVQEYATVLSSAEKNIASCYVGNTSPNIYQKGNQIIIAENINQCVEEKSTDEKKLFKEKLKELGWKKRGYICTDLWRATLVDEQILRQHIEESYNQPTEAQKVIEDFENITSIKVSPGNYKMTFMSNRKGDLTTVRSDMSDDVAKLLKLIDGQCNIYMILEKSEANTTV